MIEEFEKFLSKVRKKNGDKLLPITVEKYVYFVESYLKDFQSFFDNAELIDYMNTITKQRNNIVIYSAFRMYLRFVGVDKDDDLLRKLKKPEKNASSFTSKRFLQSKVLSRGELKRLFNEVDDEMRLIFSMLYDTACRRDELLNMKFGDVIFHSKPLNNIYGEINVLGKGAKSRTVYFGKITNDLLLKLRTNREKMKKVFEFVGENGKVLKKQDDYLYRKIHTTIQKILGRHITPHCFRHTRLTHFADNGADILGISRYAGHENISTSTIYIEVSNHVGKLTFENFAQNIVEVNEHEKLSS